MSEKKSILVVGDVMIDRYTYVHSERQAPEASIPVWDALGDEYRLGGAANTAHNIKALGGDNVDVYLGGIIGHSDRRRIGALGIDTILCAGSETMIKHRFVRRGTWGLPEQESYVFRVDSFKKFSDTAHLTFLRALDHFLEGHMFDAIVISDYDKGTLSRQAMEYLDGRSDLFIVDSKRIDLSIYRGCDVLKLNDQEYSNQVSRAPYTNVESLFANVVVTKGKDGAELRQQEQPGDKKYIIHSEMFPVISVQAKDVTGCGDTHTAAMAFALVRGQDIRAAVKFGNECARNVVKKFGTSVVDDVYN